MGGKSCFFTTRTFAMWIGLIAFVKIFGGTSTKSVLTTIERRFQLSSSIVAIISSGAQIGNLTTMLFVGYLGQRFNRPRLIGIGCLFIAMGSFLAGLPQFIGDRYHYQDISSNMSQQNFQQPVTCNASSASLTTESSSHLCDSTTSPGDSSNLFILIVMGVILTGVGDAPMLPLGFSYIDDHASEHNAAAYIGLVHTIALLGPIAGFVAGAAFLKLWVDVGWVDTASVTIHPRHPAWVGAWWLGFYVCAGTMLCVSIPIWFYPKIMAKEKEKNEPTESTEPNHNEDPTYKDSNNQNVVPEGEWGGFLPMLKKLLRNQNYLLIVASWICEAFKVSAVVTFMIKYLEVGFGKSAAQGSFLVGAYNFTFLVVGTMIGAASIKRWKMKMRGIVRLVLVFYLLTLVTYVALILVGCGPNDFAGITVPYPNSKPRDSEGAFEDKCVGNCNCDPDVFTPVCGPGNITYQSPCFAGCTERIYNEKELTMNYTSCSCVGASSDKQSVSVGSCYRSKCEGLTWLVIAITSASNLFSGLTATPKMMLLLRTLEPQEKAFGISMAFFVYRVLGWIPAPVLFGYAIDQTCLLWTQKPCSNRSYCRLYDTNRFRISYGGLLMSMKIISICLMLTLYRKVCRDSKAKQGSTVNKKDILPSELQSLNESSNDTSKEDEKESII